MSNNDFLVLKNITKSFGKSTVIDNLDLTIKRGTMVTLLGPSGCGKTTVLRLVAGLENPTSGQIFIDGEDVIFDKPIQANTLPVHEIVDYSALQAGTEFLIMESGNIVGEGIVKEIFQHKPHGRK